MHDGVEIRDCRRIVSGRGAHDKTVTEILWEEAIIAIPHAWDGTSSAGETPVAASNEGQSKMFRDQDLTLNRRYAVGTDAVWRSWTKPDFVARWWGPRGFVTTVSELEPRSGGRFRYVMTATAPDVVRFMDAHGLPRSNTVTGRFEDLVDSERLTVVQLVDFVPEIEPYEVRASLVLSTTRKVGGCRTRLTLGRMHDDEWTERCIDGWRGQLRRLASSLSAGSSGNVHI